MKEISEKLLDKKYFIFDIDGTLLDSMEMWSLADQMVIKNHLGVDVALNELKSFRDSVLYNLQNIHGDIYMIFYDEIIKLLGLDMTAEEYSEERKG